MLLNRGFWEGVPGVATQGVPGVATHGVPGVATNESRFVFSVSSSSHSLRNIDNVLRYTKVCFSSYHQDLKREQTCKNLDLIESSTSGSPRPHSLRSSPGGGFSSPGETPLSIFPPFPRARLGQTTPGPSSEICQVNLVGCRMLYYSKRILCSWCWICFTSKAASSTDVSPEADLDQIPFQKWEISKSPPRSAKTLDICPKSELEASVQQDRTKEFQKGFCKTFIKHILLPELYIFM